MAPTLCEAYVADTRPRAVLLVGSTARGLTDEYSDIDLIADHAEGPAEQRLEVTTVAIGADDYTRPQVRALRTTG